MFSKFSIAVLFLGAIAFSGCDQSKEVVVQVSPESKVAIPGDFFLAAAPTGSEGLVAVKGKVKAGDKVIFDGRIGGRKEPFVAGFALMTVVDMKMNPCSDACAAPWDYCCDTTEDIAANSATVQIVDDAGKPLALAINGTKGLAPGAKVTVVGIVNKNEADGTFIVNATSVFVGS